MLSVLLWTKKSSPLFTPCSKLLLYYQFIFIYRPTVCPLLTPPEPCTVVRHASVEHINLFSPWCHFTFLQESCGCFLPPTIVTKTQTAVHQSQILIGVLPLIATLSSLWNVITFTLLSANSPLSITPFCGGRGACHCLNGSAVEKWDLGTLITILLKRISFSSLLLNNDALSVTELPQSLKYPKQDDQWQCGI